MLKYADMIRMNVLIVLFFVCSMHTSSAQPSGFQGIIKYTSFGSADGMKDTMTVYFRHDRMRIHRNEALSNKFGGVANEITDFIKAPNHTMIYYEDSKASLLIESKSSGIDSTKAHHLDSTEVVLGFSCNKFEVFYSPHEYMGNHKVVLEQWVAPCLRYLAPDDAVSSPWHRDNSSGSIPLLFKRKVFSSLPDGSKEIKSTSMRAFEIIIKQLSDDIFELP
jgi:hypothetical protein